MRGSGQREMGNLGSSVSIVLTLLLVLVSCRLGASDTIVVRNRLGDGKNVFIHCEALVDWRSSDEIKSGDEASIGLPVFGNVVGLRPTYCMGSWDNNNVFTRIYSSYKDHQYCKDKCILEIRNSGLYRWDPVKKLWLLVGKLHE